MANLPRYTSTMSRSYHNKSCGRGCGVCGDAGETRRAREHAWQIADERELGDPQEAIKEEDALNRVPADVMEDIRKSK